MVTMQFSFKPFKIHEAATGDEMKAGISLLKEVFLDNIMKCDSN